MPWPATFSDKVTPDTEFIDEAVVPCFSCKNTFEGAGNLQMITTKFWFEYLWGPYVLFLYPVLCVTLNSEEDEEYNVRSWLHEKELTC